MSVVDIDVKTERLNRIQAVVADLQSLARFCQSCAPNHSKILKGATSMLMVVKDLTDDFFESNGELEDFEEDLKGYEKMVNKLKGPIQDAMEVWQGSFSHENNVDGPGWLDRRLRSEISFVRQLGARDHPGGVSVNNAMPMAFQGLASLIEWVRGEERSFLFLKALWDDKRRVATQLGCGPDHLTYGSSLLELWYKAGQHPEWQKVVHSCKAGATCRMAVLGSSQGLLSAYVAHTFHACAQGRGQQDRRRCVVSGYEVLPTLHKMACTVAVMQSHFLGETVVSLPTLGDMFDADLSRSHVVILTSLCWDVGTRRRIAWKLACELPRGALVVDYTDDTFSLAGLERVKGRRWRPPSPSHDQLLRGESGAHVSEEEEEEEEDAAALRALDRALSSSAEGVGCVRTRRRRLSPRPVGLVGFVEGPVSWSEEQTLALFKVL